MQCVFACSYMYMFLHLILDIFLLSFFARQIEWTSNHTHSGILFGQISTIHLQSIPVTVRYINIPMVIIHIISKRAFVYKTDCEQFG